MPPRKDFKSSKDFMVTDNDANSSSILTSPSINTDILASDEKITLPMIDNVKQSTIKKVCSQSELTIHRITISFV